MEKKEDVEVSRQPKQPTHANLSLSDRCGTREENHGRYAPPAENPLAGGEKVPPGGGKGRHGDREEDAPESPQVQEPRHELRRQPRQRGSDFGDRPREPRNGGTARGHGSGHQRRPSACYKRRVR